MIWLAVGYAVSVLLCALAGCAGRGGKALERRDMFRAIGEAEVTARRVLRSRTPTPRTYTAASGADWAMTAWVIGASERGIR